MYGKNLLLNTGTIFSIGMMVAWALLQPDAKPWLWPAILAVSAVLLTIVIVRHLGERRQHRKWLDDRVARDRAALREQPDDVARHEDLYEALTELKQPWERLSALEAWAAADPENKSVQRRLRELRAQLGEPAPPAGPGDPA